MRYVVYDVATSRIVTPKPYGKETYPTEGAAKAAKTRMLKKKRFEGMELAVSDTAIYRTCIERRVQRTNLMSGEAYWESINTPGVCSPASEAYWCK